MEVIKVTWNKFVANEAQLTDDISYVKTIEELSDRMMSWKTDVLRRWICSSALEVSKKLPLPANESRKQQACLK